MEHVEANQKAYRLRLDEAWGPVAEMIRSKIPCEEESQKLIDEISYYAAMTQDVYMEIGLQCGAALTMQLLGWSRS